MLAFLQGTVVDKEADRLLLLVGGHGYELLIHPGFSGRLPAVGQEARIECYLHVREDAVLLYGFPGREEKTLFRQLLAVSGIGPKVAQTIVGSMTPSQFTLAILAGDIKSLTGIRGIGKKSAERLIVELRDRLKRDDASSAILGTALPVTAGDAIGEALAALLFLGYHTSEAEAALKAAAVTAEDDVEAIIRRALVVLGSRQGAR